MGLALGQRKWLRYYIIPDTYLDDHPFRDRKYTDHTRRPQNVWLLIFIKFMFAVKFQKRNSSIYQLNTTFSTTIPSFSINLNRLSSSTLSIFSLSFMSILNWKLHTSFIFYRYFHDNYALISLTVYLLSSCGLAAQNFLLSLIPILPTSLIQ